jgi:hypothetical protein
VGFLSQICLPSHRILQHIYLAALESHGDDVGETSRGRPVYSEACLSRACSISSVMIDLAVFIAAYPTPPGECLKVHVIPSTCIAGTYCKSLCFPHGVLLAFCKNTLPSDNAGFQVFAHNCYYSPPPLTIYPKHRFGLFITALKALVWGKRIVALHFNPVIVNVSVLPSSK